MLGGAQQPTYEWELGCLTILTDAGRDLQVRYFYRDSLTATRSDKRASVSAAAMPHSHSHSAASQHPVQSKDREAGRHAAVGDCTHRLHDEKEAASLLFLGPRRAATIGEVGCACVCFTACHVACATQSTSVDSLSQGCAWF